MKYMYGFTELEHLEKWFWVFLKILMEQLFKFKSQNVNVKGYENEMNLILLTVIKYNT